MTSLSDHAGTSASPGLGAASDAEAAALAGLPAVWLRDSCCCAICRDARTGQRLVSITDQPEQVWMAAVSVGADSVTVVFGPDGHQSVYPRSWLADQQSAPEDARNEDAKRLWAASDHASRVPQASWPLYLADEAHRAECLDKIMRDGFVLLRDVPPEPGTVLTVAESMGFVRETNYGRLFDVRVEATPSNLAFTALPIAPHTDNPYRDPVPTVQLLHCLTSAVAGGDSGLVDGFLAAGILRAEDPAAFAVLTGSAVTFTYCDPTVELTATRPMIGLDPRGRIREVRFNNRSMQPLRPSPGERPSDAADRAVAFYAAYRAFAAIVARPDLMLKFRLEEGDCVVFDNTRILHARTAFAATGNRHLQGCYCDLDGVASTLAVLRRRHAADRGSGDGSAHGGGVRDGN